MKPYAQILSSVDKEFKAALEDFQNDPLFLTKKALYTKEEQRRIGYRWMNLVRPFNALKRVIRSLMWRSFFTFWNKNIFIVKYATIVTYYNMVSELQKAFWSHEEFIRQYLDDNFKENYSTLARFIYRIRFLAVLSYPREFFLILKANAPRELLPLFDRKEKASVNLQERFSLDSINIWYYIRYRISLLFTWISKNWGRMIMHLRFSSRKGWLIKEENIRTALAEMEPGDILLTRQNWGATNINIPGFWKHMAMYLWTGAYLRKNHGEYRSVFVDLEDTTHYIIEAIWVGVRIISIEELCSHNDYLWVLRPKFGQERKGRAIKKTLWLVGKDYDYSFNFYSDVNYVCSTLVTKSYLKEYAKDEGIDITLTRIGTWITYPPNDLARKYENELGTPRQELDFVAFIDSRESDKTNFMATEKVFRSSGRRPKLSLFLS